jgi:outer membrane lipoprotein SlyB
MIRQLSVVVAGLLIIGLAAPEALAQGTQSRPEYTDKEKQKLAEIAKRPEVIAQINSAWEKVRRDDVEFAFRVNTTAGQGDWRNNPQWLDMWSKYGRLYDNPILVNYVNGLGQRLVPKDSPHLYAFRLLFDPTPRAEALSTGTIYVSTGLVSMLDNEAQLAYVLAHEIAHIERNHMYDSIRNEILDNELDKELEKSAQKKRAIFSLAAAAGGGALGAAIGGKNGVGMGILAGAVGGSVAGAVLFRNKFEPTEWSAVHESEADESALNTALAQRFDLRQVPPVYTRLAGLVAKDKRVGLGFIGDGDRLKQRTAYVEGQITGPLKTRIDASLAQGGLVGSSAEFSVLMAALKRDNGILAMDYDLMPMAKENLVDAEKIRSNDPRVQFYLGQLYALTGKTAEEKQEALTHLQSAIRYDNGRGSFPEPHLQYALYLIAQNNPASQAEVQTSLKKYVALYQREHAGQLPNNMHIIYDYFLMAGDDKYYAPPVAVIAPRENEPMPVVMPSAAAAPAPAAPPRRPNQ